MIVALLVQRRHIRALEAPCARLTAAASVNTYWHRSIRHSLGCRRLTLRVRATPNLLLRISQTSRSRSTIPVRQRPAVLGISRLNWRPDINTTAYPAVRMMPGDTSIRTVRRRWSRSPFPRMKTPSSLVRSMYKRYLPDGVRASIVYQSTSETLANLSRKTRRLTKKTCEVCKRTVSALRRHMRSMHNDNFGRVKIDCPIENCENKGFWLDRMDNLRQHLILKHHYSKGRAGAKAKEAAQKIN